MGNRFLQKVSDLHENSRLKSDNNKTKYLWNVEWDYFMEQSGCIRAFNKMEVFVWLLGFLLYASIIGLIVYKYCTHYDVYDDVIVLPLFFLFEIIDVISLFFHGRIWIISLRLLPNIDINSKNVQNGKVEDIWNALDVTEDEMIRHIEKIYNNMFVKAKGIQPLYELIEMYSTTVNKDITGKITEFLSLPLQRSLEENTVSTDIKKERHASVPATETIQNTDYDEENEIGFDDEIDFTITNSSEEHELVIDFTETRL